MSRLKNTIKNFFLMLFIFTLMVLIIQYDPEYLIGAISSLVTFYLLKIIYSDHLYFIFNKKRYALSFVRLMYMPLFLIRRYLGEKLGNIVYSVLFPCAFIALSGESWAILFPLFGAAIFFILKHKKILSK